MRWNRIAFNYGRMASGMADHIKKSTLTPRKKQQKSFTVDRYMRREATINFAREFDH
jgi:hypothetical protein